MLAEHTAQCQRFAVQRAKDKAKEAAGMMEEGEGDEEEEDMYVGLLFALRTFVLCVFLTDTTTIRICRAVSDPRLEGPAHRQSTDSKASAAAAAAEEAPEEEAVVVLPEGWAPEEMPSGLASSLSASLTVQVRRPVIDLSANIHTKD